MTDTSSNGNTEPEVTPPGRAISGRFLPGNKIGTGRRKGARSKLSESFLQDFHKTWLKHGPKALDKVAQENPGLFVKVAASILPKALEVDGRIEHTNRNEFVVELQDFTDAYRKWGSVIGADKRMIELQPVRDDDDTEPDEHG
jgi:hypothetical protein